MNANEIIQYTNHSRTTLKSLFFHLWPNAYKDQTTALAKQLLAHGATDFYYSYPEQKGFIFQLSFTQDTTLLQLKYDSINPDIVEVILAKPILPESTIELKIPFRVAIPDGMFSRMGHQEKQYQISQWYPKPAVFDKSGWHKFPFLDQGEFYAEFGNYDVSITLPKSYVLAATGELQSTHSDDSIFTTYHYSQNNIHDFAWFCDPTYKIIKGEIELPHSHRKVTTYAYYLPEHESFWSNAVSDINAAIYYYSLWVGDYPYDVCKAVDGALSAGGGMEYPTITVVSGASEAVGLDNVIAHEVGHNWFYGILGSNERDHAWMDEGINSFYEMRYMNLRYPSLTLLHRTFKNDLLNLNHYSSTYEHYLNYALMASKNLDQPIELTSAKFTKSNYPAIVYSKTALILNYLQAYLGEDSFDRAMQDYFETFKFKHPQPEDFSRLLIKNTKQNLSWFFDDLLNSNRKIDYALEAVITSSDSVMHIRVANKGEVAGPFPIAAVKDKKCMKQIWYQGFKGEMTVDFPKGDYDQLKIDYFEKIPELDRSNNSMFIHKALFETTPPLKFQPLISLKNPNANQVFFSPVAGWNQSNGIMLGMAFYNTTLPLPQTDYQLVPMYAFNNRDLAGYAAISHDFYPVKNQPQHFQLALNASRFAFTPQPTSYDYVKIAPSITYFFKPSNPLSVVADKIALRSVSIFQTNGNHYTINQCLYTHEVKRAINPSTTKLDAQQIGAMLKTSIEFRQLINLNSYKNDIEVRCFAGVAWQNAFYKQSDNTNNYSFKISGWSGNQDYMYDNVFFDRQSSTGMLSQQFVEQDGGFKINTMLGQTNRWLLAVNLKTSFHSTRFFQLYADVGKAANDAMAASSFLYEAGIDLSVVNNFLDIYLPVVLCNQFTTNLQSNHIDYLQQIRFTLNINLLNPFNFIKNFNL